MWSKTIPIMPKWTCFPKKKLRPIPCHCISCLHELPFFDRCIVVPGMEKKLRSIPCLALHPTCLNEHALKKKNCDTSHVTASYAFMNILSLTDALWSQAWKKKLRSIPCLCIPSCLLVYNAPRWMQRRLRNFFQCNHNATSTTNFKEKQGAGAYVDTIQSIYIDLYIKPSFGSHKQTGKLLKKIKKKRSPNNVFGDDDPAEVFRCGGLSLQVFLWYPWKCLAFNYIVLAFFSFLSSFVSCSSFFFFFK